MGRGVTERGSSLVITYYSLVVEWEMSGLSHLLAGPGN